MLEITIVPRGGVLRSAAITDFQNCANVFINHVYSIYKCFRFSLEPSSVLIIYSSLMARYYIPQSFLASLCNSTKNFLRFRLAIILPLEYTGGILCTIISIHDFGFRLVI